MLLAGAPEQRSLLALAAVRGIALVALAPGQEGPEWPRCATADAGPIPHGYEDLFALLLCAPLGTPLVVLVAREVHVATT